LFGRYRNTYTNDPSVAGASNGTANTNVIWHGRKLLALKEDSLPIELDRETLATKGNWNYDGRMTARCMTAHPKLDTATGELLSFSFQARGDCTTDLAYWVIDKNGKITHETWFEAPYAGWVHDSAITEEHVIFPMTPMIIDLEVLKRGGPFSSIIPTRTIISPLCRVTPLRPTSAGSVVRLEAPGTWSTPSPKGQRSISTFILSKARLSFRLFPRPTAHFAIRCLRLLPGSPST
jgi:carotenoid cleavage dioxygenase-like enzyme